LPLLRRENFTEAEIEQLTVRNPAAALAVRVRATA
jgi:predicted metal-dependent phosphotriesterase family hydrolase